MYEEVGAVELEIEWGPPDGYMSESRIEAIVERARSGEGGSVVDYEDPMVEVREIFG